MTLAEHPTRAFHVPKAASAIRKRSVVIHDIKTSLSLEDEFWTLLKKIAAGSGMTIAALVERIDAERSANNLSSACRVHVLNHFCRA